MYIYLVTSPAFRALRLVKIGLTQEPYGRQSTYLTGCPPGQAPSYDLDYEALWETTATTREELYGYEEEIHQVFFRYRLQRNMPGDTEWFQMPSVSVEEEKGDPFQAIYQAMESRPWVRRRVALEEIVRPRRAFYLCQAYHKNIGYIKQGVIQQERLTEAQYPVIQQIVTFLAGEETAGTVVAPCGSGKTTMTARAISTFQRIMTCVVCCPSHLIQTQWRNTLLREGCFTEDEICLVGGKGTTDVDVLHEWCGRDRFCILTTYASSHLLVGLLTPGMDLLVLDEAHHMAGAVAVTETGVGRTRRLMAQAVELGVKRLSLTYTPRYLQDARMGVQDARMGVQDARMGVQDARMGVQDARMGLSMDDEAVFGKRVAELQIRDLIQKGILPDYRLWTLRDEGRKGAGIRGKAECLLEAWEAKEMERGVERYILHHMIVFTATTEEAKQVEEIFRARIGDTLVQRVEEGDSLEGPIQAFTEAKRSILVNCFVLTEGVDIPAAQAVAITYPKQSRGQITQMVLRAGRWYPGKALFHILLPTLGEEDMSGFEEVLMALAGCDEGLCDEILARAKAGAGDKGGGSGDEGQRQEQGQGVERIMMETFEADPESLRRCFTNIRRGLFDRRTRELCWKEGVRTSLGYSRLRQEMPELPEDPRPRGVLWYDYLEPSAGVARMAPAEFVGQVLIPRGIRSAEAYETWRGTAGSDTGGLPSAQNIADGYFGADYLTVSTLLARYAPRVDRGRGRR